jgi:hypothetical protein
MHAHMDHDTSVICIKLVVADATCSGTALSQCGQPQLSKPSLHADQMLPEAATCAQDMSSASRIPVM